MQPAHAWRLRAGIDMTARFQSCNTATSPGTADATDLAGLARIFDADCNLARMPRALPSALSDFLDQVAVHSALRGLPRTVLDCGQTLTPHALPAQAGRQILLDEVRLCGELLCDLTGSPRFGLRIEVLDRAMCPRWHVDQVGLRLLVTWRGPATEWLDEACADRSQLGGDGVMRDSAGIRQALAGDIVLLKGERWPGNAARGVIHRSPCIDDDAPRIVAAFDSIW